MHAFNKAAEAQRSDIWTQPLFKSVESWHYLIKNKIPWFFCFLNNTLIYIFGFGLNLSKIKKVRLDAFAENKPPFPFLIGQLGMKTSKM